MTQEINSPYAVHFPKTALNHEVSFLAILKQFFYPTIRQEAFCFNTTGFKSVYEAVKKSYDFQISRSRIDQIRSGGRVPTADTVDVMDDKDYAIWLDSKTINLVVNDEVPGRTKIVVNLGGYQTTTNMKSPSIMDIEEKVIGTFYLSSIFRENVYTILFGTDGYDFASLAESGAVPFSFTPVINFSFKSKKADDQKTIHQLLEELDAQIHKEAFKRVMWNLGATVDSKIELVPFVDVETIKEEIMTVFNNWKDWNGGYDSPMSFSYSATVIPKINDNKSTAGNVRIAYEWRHVLEIASTKTFLIPLESITLS